MKQLFLFIIFFLITQLIIAQDSTSLKPKKVSHDTIVMRNGEIIIAKVVEINPNNIKYRRIDNPDGPLYTIPKEQIKVIVYVNGMKDSFEDYVPPKINSPLPVDLAISPSGWNYFYKERRISERDMLAVAEKLGDKKINLAIKKTENIRFMHGVTLVGGIVLFPIGFLMWASNAPRYGRRISPATKAALTRGRTNGEYLMLGALACDVVSIGLRFDRKKHAHVVMDMYNKVIVK